MNSPFIARLLIPLLAVAAARAEEGGAGHYVPGSMATLIDLAPTKPGWVIESMYLHYEGTAAATRTLPIGGLLAGGLDATIGIGFNAFYYEQIEGDSGRGATLGDFKGMTTGIGPVVTYVLPIDDNTLVVEGRWLPELDTRRRLEGDYIWLKAVYQF
jgi:hypothetical protein